MSAGVGTRVSAAGVGVERSAQLYSERGCDRARLAGARMGRHAVPATTGAAGRVRDQRATRVEPN